MPSFFVALLLIARYQGEELKWRGPLRSEFWTRKNFLRLPRFHEIVATLLIVFWGLPELGHQILLRSNYYGLGDAEIFNNGKIDCFNSLEDVPRIKGRFLFVYPYKAFAMELCEVNPLSGKQRIVSEKVYARSPHTFLTNWAEKTAPGESHKVILNRIIKRSGS